jgi:hypothetical protein
MVKSKKKISINNRQLFKSKKLLRGGGGVQSGYTFGQLRLSGDTVGNSLKSMERLQDTTKQASLVTSALEAPMWGTSKGASSYTKIKGNLISIRHSNIEAMVKITKTLGNPSKNIQRTAIKNIKSLARATNREKYQKILQSKRDIESSFKNTSVPRKSDKSEMYNSVSQRVHLARSNVLLDIATLVRIETLKLNSLLTVVLNNKDDQSFSRDTDSDR